VREHRQFCQLEHEVKGQSNARATLDKSMTSSLVASERRIVLLPPGDSHLRHTPLTRMPRKQLQKGFPLMARHWHKAAWALLATPVCAFGFEAVDVLTPASSGLYPLA